MGAASTALRQLLAGARPRAPAVMFRKLKRKLPAPIRAAAGRVGRLLATAYRVSLLRRVTFIGVTGSVGKTTTKELLAAILACRFTGRKSEGNHNVLMYSTTFRVRPWDQYCVQEISAAVSKERLPLLERSLRIVRPSIGIVTGIRTDHLSVFGSVEAIAAEKGKLVAALPETGTAVLNADDPLVLAMRPRCRGKVVTYGLAADATVRAENVASSWPDRLSLDVVHGGERQHVRTQLCGAHWVPCVLAAIAASLAMGVPLAVAARAVGTVPPAEQRMQPVTRADGVTFVRDDAKAPLHSIAMILDFVRSARASRKIVVIGTISDYKAKSGAAYNQVARQALDVADLVLFVGPKSSKCAKSKKHPKGEALLMFHSAELAAEYLGEILEPGDLVLLKGSEHADHLEPIISAARGRQRSLGPGECATSPHEPATSPVSARGRSVAQGGPATKVPASGSVRVIAGLGNPGERYQETPHNIGHRVLDRLAHSLGGDWELRGETLVAAVERDGSELYLVKLMTPVNGSGPVLARLSRELALGPAECLLVHDDVDLPLGTVRVRARGSDGGHRGVRSIIEAFRTDLIARVKVGVGRPERPGEVARHVVRPLVSEPSAPPRERQVLRASSSEPAQPLHHGARERRTG